MWSRRSISANAAASARAASLSEATANFNSSEDPSTFSNCETRHALRARAFAAARAVAVAVAVAVDGWPPLPAEINRRLASASVNFIRRLFIYTAVKSNQELLAIKFKMQKIDYFFKPPLCDAAFEDSGQITTMAARNTSPRHLPIIGFLHTLLFHAREFAAHLL